MNLCDYAKKNDRFNLLLEWDRAGNPGLDPSAVAASSRQRVSWVCEQGHRWDAVVCTRVNRNSGCPYCAGQRAVAGKTDITSLRPELVPLWHPTRNGDLTPDQVCPTSHKKVWWQCERGHEWQACVYAVSDGSRCPYCSGFRAIPGETDLATTHPEIAAEWDGTKNQLPVSSVSAGSAKKVWWRCKEGHSYESHVYTRVSGSGCPYCAGKKVLKGFNDLATSDPALAEEWAGHGLKPTEVTRSSHKLLSWKCPEGHLYEAAPYARVAGNGCPYCAGRKVLAGFNDLATTHPRLAKEWYEELNGSLTPETVSKGSNQKVWWQCAEGHVWQAAVFSRTRTKGTGCPVCAGQVKVQFQGRYMWESVVKNRNAPVTIKPTKAPAPDSIAV